MEAGTSGAWNPDDEDPARGKRFTAWRGFVPYATAASARDIRALWEARLAQSSVRTPVWMHVHVPYCPQLCSFCHCGRLLLTDPQRLEEWIERTRAEIAFFAPALKGAFVRHQYFGGGTPNLLTPQQLDTLFGMLEDNFEHDPTGRRTLEMLPSIYRRETLEVAARHGLRRVSCGVQSTDGEVLGLVQREPDIAPLRRLMNDARDLGFTDVDIDLAWGFQADSEAHFFRSLTDVLALGPESVAVHLLAPTARNPLYKTFAEERDVYRRFRALPHGDGARALAQSFPDYEWRLLPTVAVVVRRDYVEAGEYHSWQYSDMETFGMDMFGLGRYSLSHLPGWGRYENKTDVSAFDPDEAGFRLAITDGAIDAAMDVLSDLLCDRSCAPERVAARYGEAAVRPALEALDALERSGSISRRGGRYEYLLPADSVFMGPVKVLLEDVVVPRSLKLNPGALDGKPIPAAGTENRSFTPLSADRLARRKVRELEKATGPTQGVGEQFELPVNGVPVTVVVEPARRESQYYRVIGDLGVYYAQAPSVAPAALSAAMEQVTRNLADILRQRNVTATEARQELEQRLAGRTGA